MVNPIGMSAVFLDMTKNYSAAKRHNMAYKVALFGAILVISALFIGPYILKFFGISLSYVQVAGGMVVFYTAWNMLDTKPKISSREEQEALEHADITFFPLTMPITAGAGTLAVTMALASRLAQPNNFDLLGHVSVMSAIIIVFLIVGFCYRFADSIFNKLGITGTNVITRLTAFILLAISVSVIWEGILGLIIPIMHR